jgi:hypothetical protein
MKEQNMKREDAQREVATGKLKADMNKRLYTSQEGLAALNNQSGQAAINVIDARYEKEKSLASLNTQMYQQTNTMVENLATGMAAGAQARMQVVNALQDQIDVVNKKYLAYQEAAALGDENQYLYLQKLKELDVERVGLISQQAQAAKSMNDMWISALGAQIVGTGRIMKIAITQNENMGAGLKHLPGMVRSFRSGAVGREGEKEVGTREGEVATPYGVLNPFMGQHYRSDVGPQMENFDLQNQQKLRQGYTQFNQTRVAAGKKGGFAASALGAQPYAPGAVQASFSGQQGVAKIGITAPTVEGMTGGSTALTLNFTFNGLNKKEIIDTVGDELAKNLNKMQDSRLP